MGLSLDRETKQLFIEWFRERAAAAREGDGSVPPKFALVAVDCLCFFRMIAPRGGVTIDALAFRCYSEILKKVAPGGDIHLLFDTQENMPPERDEVAYKRAPPATFEALKRHRADPSDKRVEMNGRLFDFDKRPYSRDDLESFDRNTEFIFARAMNSRAGKEWVWSELERAVLVHFATDRSAIEYRVVIDGTTTGEKAVATLEKTALPSSEMKVDVCWSRREIAFGEADQKLAYVMNFTPRRVPGACLGLTIDSDILAQMLCLSDRRPESHRDTWIGFFPHSTMKTREITYIDTVGLPTDQSGTSIALFMCLNGTDYSRSLIGAGLSPKVAFNRGLAKLRPVLRVKKDGSFATVDSVSLVQLLRQAFSGKTRDVFSFDVEHGAFISKASAVAAAERYGHSGPVRKRPRRIDDFHRELEPLLWLLSYWSMIGISKTPACPAPFPPSRIFEFDLPLSRLFQHGHIDHSADVTIA